MNILSLPVLRSDRRIHYGHDPSHFGDLWLPKEHVRRPVPLVVFFHGGWWKSEYDLGYAGYLCAALREEGIATWSVEYRRVGATGGGWPATFRDAAAGFDYVANLAETYNFDLDHVITMGHSAGGHLAFWVAGRDHVPAGSPLQVAGRVALQGAISLAGAVDLRLLIALAGDALFAHDRDEVQRLMGGSPEQVPERYAAGNPGDLLPFQVPQTLIQGTEDDQIPPELPPRWIKKARAAGSHATGRLIPGADHFDLVDPRSKAWTEVLGEIKAMIGLPGHGR